jgi:hypothetical protein
MSRFDTTVTTGPIPQDKGEMGFRGGRKGWNGKNKFISEGEQKVIEKKLQMIREKKAVLDTLN